MAPRFYVVRQNPNLEFTSQRNTNNEESTNNDKKYPNIHKDNPNLEFRMPDKQTKIEIINDTKENSSTFSHNPNLEFVMPSEVTTSNQDNFNDKYNNNDRETVVASKTAHQYNLKNLAHLLKV